MAIKGVDVWLSYGDRVNANIWRCLRPSPVAIRSESSWSVHSHDQFCQLFANNYLSEEEKKNIVFYRVCEIGGVHTDIHADLAASELRFWTLQAVSRLVFNQS
ncbi:hypothetical protein NXS19_001611 [Fusarium pseudograminearum]|nr:hypothetical protein NXS19_001611 [Fusarium pseudograminearum]